MSKRDQSFPGNDTSDYPRYSPGLTKREYAAIHIAAGIMAVSEELIHPVWEEAVKIADKLLEELDKK